MTETTLKMWWPHPDAFHDLEVTDTDEGWQLSAPDESELGNWIEYWNQDEEHHEFFQAEFISVLLEHVKTLETEHGQTEAIPDQQTSDREQAEKDSTGMLP